MRWITMGQRDERGNITPNGVMRARAQVDGMRASARQRTAEAAVAGQSLSPASIIAAPWSWLGPGNIGGRIRALAIHPTSPSIIFAGSVGGGIWKSTNGGASWAPVDDFMANLSVSCIVFLPGNPNVIFAGTGEGFYNFDAIQGAGIFKSTDGGTTWTQMPSTNDPNFLYVNRLAFSADGTVLLAATSKGLFRTTSLAGNLGGAWSFSLLPSPITDVLDVKFLPGSSRNVVAAGKNKNVYYSTLAGAAAPNWSPSSGLAGGVQERVELGVSASSPNVVYASVDEGGGQIWKSVDNGATFVEVSAPGHLSTQGWYDNALWVDPTNASHVIAGGIDLWESLDGGASFARMSAQSGGYHVDQHAIVSDPGFDGVSNWRVYFGNDGGVFKWEDLSARTLVPLNNNLGVTQFYAGAAFSASGKVFGGTQDNGTLLYSPAGGPQAWTKTFGGDGGFVGADQCNTAFLYGEVTNLDVFRSSDGGASAAFIAGCSKAAPFRLDDACNLAANFIAPILLDPNEPRRLLAGGQSLWRTNDARTATTITTGPSWIAIKAPTSSNSYISAIAVAQGNPDLIWVGHNNGDVYVTSNGSSASPFWVQKDSGTPLPNRMVTSIALDPLNTNVVYVSFGGFTTNNLWKSVDGGTTWTSASGGSGTSLPSAPVRSVVTHPTVAGWIYVGTDVGVFASQDGGANWILPQEGPANVAVFQLFWLGTSLVAATHGRGMFMMATDAPAAFNKSGPSNGAVGQLANPTLSWGASSGATTYEYCIDSTNDSNCDGSWISTGTATSVVLSGLTPGATYYWQVRAQGNLGTTQSDGGSWWSFTTLPPLPGGFTKSTPSNGALGQPNPLTLSWGSSTNAASYEYCVNTSNTSNCGSSWISTGAATNVVLSGLVSGATYYWQVQARNAAGATAADGASWWKFATVPSGANSSFVQQGLKLVGTGGGTPQGFSVSLSNDGNTAIVGGTAPGVDAVLAWIWTRVGGVWTQQSPELLGSGAVGLLETTSLSLSGDGNTAVVGGAGDNSNSGAVWVWTKTGAGWTQQGPKLVGSGASGQFVQQGSSVSLSADGNTAIVGGHTDNGGVGAAWVWTRTAGVWTQQGSKSVGSGAIGNAQQGSSVCLSADGNTAIVGGGADNGDVGAAWIWTRSNGVWSQQGSKLVGSGAIGNAGQGYSVSLSADGKTAIVGGSFDNSSLGAAWVWTTSGGVWTQQGAKLVGPNDGQSRSQGSSVALSADGSTAIIGEGNFTGVVGGAWIWKRTAGTWTQRGPKLVGSDALGTASQGWSVALSGDGNTAIIGGPFDNGGIGAAWVFAATTPPDTELLGNGDFSNGASNWTQFATPDTSYMVSNVSNGVFQFYRQPATPGTSNQAVVFQESGVPLEAGAPVTAQFDLGNSSTTRKRISVLILDHDFSDLSVCTFWLAPNAPMRTYGMRTHSTQAWTNAAIYFYAATAGSDGGFYELSNVSLEFTPSQSSVRTECIDPTAPSPPGGVASANLLTNGDFSGGLSSWGLFGQITSQVSNAVFEFIRPPGDPAGVILQPSGATTTANEVLTATFDLGNSSTVRKRVTVLMHDLDFSDLTACTFWLAPGAPLATYAMRGFSTKGGANATLSIYPATVGLDQWIRLDNAALQRTPGVTITGTQCLEPGDAEASSVAAVSAANLPVGTTSVSAAAPKTDPAPTVQAPRATSGSVGEWLPTSGFAPTADPAFATGLGWRAEATATGQQTLTWAQTLNLHDATSTHLRFRSWLSPGASSGQVQVSVDATNWQSIAAVPASDDWVDLDVDLSAFAGQIIFVRFVYDAVAPADGTAPDVWRLDDIQMTPVEIAR